MGSATEIAARGRCQSHLDRCICTGQKNGDEKSQQVMHMAKIYKQAQGVVIWLGAGTGQGRMAIRLIKEPFHRDMSSLLHDHFRCPAR
jgi:hypothetical protein